MTYVALWARAFVFTVLVELAVAPPLLKRSRTSFRRRAAAVVVANLASHPAVWFVFPAFGLAHLPTIVLSEAWAVGLEFLIYLLVLPGLRRSDALAASAIANAASFVGWLLLRSHASWF